MISLPFGSIILAVVFLYAITGMDWRVLLNAHSIVLVFVGTLGVLAVSTPMAQIKALIRATLRLRDAETPTEEVEESLLELSRNRKAQVKTSHPLIDYAQELWEQGVEEDIFAQLMYQKLDELKQNTEAVVTTIRNLAKYPPALGMTGTVIGLVSLFTNLTPETKDQIGPALALAMTATFYGLFFANAILMPFADRLHILHLKNVKTNDEVHQIIMLIHYGEPAGFIEEEIRQHAG